MTRLALLLPVLALLLVAASPEEETEHTVTAGETLYGIANRAKVSREAIITANGLTPPYVVKTGEVLKIPRTRRHRVAAKDTPFGLAWRYGVQWSDIAIANDLPADAKLRRGQELLIPSVIAPPGRSSAPGVQSSASSPSAAFAWPLRGTVRRPFAPSGPREHSGLDITARAGTAVRAAAAGRVVFAGKEPQDFGNLVVLDHGDGWHSAYGFLQRTTVREGDRVRSGERIGLVGRTGRAKGDELHFELRRDNRPVDPVPLLAAPQR